MLVKYTYFGDADLNGVIDATDYFLINSAFGLQSGPLSNSFQSLDSPAGPGGSGGLGAAPAAAPVPEPASLAVLALGATGLLMRRKKTRG